MSEIKINNISVPAESVKNIPIFNHFNEISIDNRDNHLPDDVYIKNVFLGVSGIFYIDTLNPVMRAFAIKYSDHIVCQKLGRKDSNITFIHENVQGLKKIEYTYINDLSDIVYFDELMFAEFGPDVSESDIDNLKYYESHYRLLSSIDICTLRYKTAITWGDSYMNPIISNKKCRIIGDYCVNVLKVGSFNERNLMCSLNSSDYQIYDCNADADDGH